MFKHVQLGRNLQIFLAVKLLCEMCKLQSLYEGLETCFHGFSFERQDTCP